MKGVGLTSKCSQLGGFGPVSGIDLMEDPEFFHCERFRCNMLRTRCVDRQNIEHLGLERRLRGKSKEFAVVGFPECRNCDQGKTMWTEFNQGLDETPEERTRTECYSIPF
jgi:hypothetical protein